MAKEQGKNTPIDIGVLDNGAVAIQFGLLVKQVVFTPEQAISFGVNLIKAGTRAESIQRVSPPGKTAQGPRRTQ